MDGITAAVMSIILHYAEATADFKNIYQCCLLEIVQIKVNVRLNYLKQTS